MLIAQPPREAPSLSLAYIDAKCSSAHNRVNIRANAISKLMSSFGLSLVGAALFSSNC
jgi:hypothetical protein